VKGNPTSLSFTVVSAQRATSIDLSYLREVFERFGLLGELERFRVPSRIRTDALQDLAMAVHEIEQELSSNPGACGDVRDALCRAADNIARNARRREAREAARSAPIDQAPESSTAEDLAEVRPMFRRLLDALDELPREQRVAVIASDLDGDSHEEIAEAGRRRGLRDARGLVDDLDGQELGHGRCRRIGPPRCGLLPQSAAPPVQRAWADLLLCRKLARQQTAAPPLLHNPPPPALGLGRPCSHDEPPSRTQ
jgi:hypothetical protein